MFREPPRRSRRGWGAREALDLHFVFVLAVFVLSNVKEVLVVGDDVDADR